MTEIIRKNPDETAQWMMSREQSTLLQEGEKMKNESVKHVRYGTGRVAEVVQNHMVVLFDGEAGRKVFLILSILVDTFCSRISLSMPPIPKSHNTACVLS